MMIQPENPLLVLAFCLGACDSISNHDELSGKWVERDGVMVCDGYLTRIEDEDHCVAAVPDDWQEFIFDGKTYYMQPLQDDGLET